MKKWLGILFVVGMACILLGACSDSGGSGDPATKGSDVEVPEDAVEIVMWNLFAGGDAEYMQEIVDKYNESQSTYFVNNIMQENAEYYTKLLTSIGAGQGPDVAISHDYVLPELVNQGLIQDISSVDTEGTIQWNDYNKNILDATIFDGANYAVPIDTHAQIMYLNNELVDKAGLLNDDGTAKLEETPEGYVDFFNTLKENLDDGEIPFSFSTNGHDPYWLWWAFYTQLGGEHILSEESLENPSYALDREKAIESANLVQSLYQEHEVIPLNLQDFYSNFQSGEAAVTTTGVWATGIWETTDGLDFTPMPIPQLYDNPGVWGSSHTLVLPYYDNTDEEVMKGAVEFMEFVADNGAMWAQAGHIPAKDTVVASDEFQEMPYRNQYAEVADYVNFLDRTIYTRGLQDIVVQELNTVWAGDATPEEAFDRIEQESTSLIE